MSVTLHFAEEALSAAYVSTILSRAGYTFRLVQNDEGITAEVKNVRAYKGMMVDCGVIFNLQIRAVKHWTEDQENIICEIPLDVYSRLTYRSSNSITPIYLVVLCLPEQEADWVVYKEDELVLTGRCYYTYLRGDTIKQEAVRKIKIPKKNIFSLNNIKQLGRSMKGEN